MGFLCKLSNYTKLHAPDCKLNSSLVPSSQPNLVPVRDYGSQEICKDDHFQLGGFPTIRHNEIRDTTASLLTEVCHNVATKPPLQPLTGETFNARSANTDDNARLDIRARGFWNTTQDAFFDVRVFYPNASNNRSTLISSAYRRHEQAKKREYGQRVRDVEHGVFTPLVFSSTGGMGMEATTFLQRACGYDCTETTAPIPDRWSCDG